MRLRYKTKSCSGGFNLGGMSYKSPKERLEQNHQDVVNENPDIVKIKDFATYGSGPHHTIVCIKNNSGTWSSKIEEGDYATVKELYEGSASSDKTIKVFRLD